MPDARREIIILTERESTCLLLSTALKTPGVDIIALQDSESGISLIRHRRPQVVLTELALPGPNSGLDVLAAVQAFDPGIKVLVLAANGSPATAIDAIQMGAAGCIVKPVALGELREQVRGLLKDEPVDPLARLAPHFRYALLEPAPRDAEAVARRLHALSPARSGPFVALDFGRVAAGEMEDAIFGHMRDAFPGTAADQPGALEKAGGGVLFLGEVGVLAPALQTDLAAALKHKETQRIGSLSPRRIDVRVIACFTFGALEDDLRQLLTPIDVTQL